jgi:hypothetical protein
MLVCAVTASHAEKSSLERANFAAIHSFVPSVHGLRISSSLCAVLSSVKISAAHQEPRQSSAESAVPVRFTQAKPS